MPSQALNHGSSISEIQPVSSAFYAPHDTEKKKFCNFLDSCFDWSIVSMVSLNTPSYISIS